MAIYGYVRVGTLQQANEGDSLETQLKQIGSYASLRTMKYRLKTLLQSEA